MRYLKSSTKKIMSRPSPGAPLRHQVRKQQPRLEQVKPTLPPTRALKISVSTQFVVNLLGVLRDFVMVYLVFIEGSFTNSSGRHYAFGDFENVGGFIFGWLCANFILGLLRNIGCIFFRTLGAFDPTSTLLYLFAFVAVWQYAHFINLDYVELGEGEDVGFWETLNAIKTLGNHPRQFVEAEAISWAMVEMFVYIMIVADFVYCVFLLTQPIRDYLR